MAKSHVVKLTISNHSGKELKFTGDWFDSGRLGDSESWPKTIKDGDHQTVTCYEKDWSMAGCSGYCTYSLDGTGVTIGFSNPSSGKNKLGVGTGGKKVWSNMGDHDYKAFVQEFTASGNSYYANCKCSGGDVNTATVQIHPKG